MAHVEGWINFTAAVQNANDAKVAAFTGKPVNEILNLTAFALMQHAAATRDALDKLYERIERLHHKIDNMQAKRP